MISHVFRYKNFYFCAIRRVYLDPCCLHAHSYLQIKTILTEQHFFEVIKIRGDCFLGRCFSEGPQLPKRNTEAPKQSQTISHKHQSVDGAKLLLSLLPDNSDLTFLHVFQVYFPINMY